MFWQSYLEHLPTSLVRGGKLASPGTRYPVVYAAVPRGEDPGDFGYLFEDLASRGFLVAAGVSLPEGPAVAAFDWGTVLTELVQPWSNPQLWLEPDLTRAKGEGPTDFRWVAPAQEAMRQFDAEPGDLLFSSIDWGRQGLWTWGYGPPSAVDQKAWGIRSVVHAGGRPPAGYHPVGSELWILGGPAPRDSVPGQWFLTVPRLSRADLSDAAYLRPALAFFGLKSQADAGFHGAFRQYQAAFFQFAFWGSGGVTTFDQTVPEVPGLSLSGR